MHFRSVNRSLGVTTLLLVTVVLAGCRPPDIERVGGVIYVYELAPNSNGKAAQLDLATQQSMTTALSRRLDPNGTRGIRVSFNQAGRIEIAVPGQDERQRAEVQALAAATGRLEFLILANPADHAALIDKALATTDKLVKEDDRVIGRWVDVIEQGKSGSFAVAGLGETEVLRDGQSGESLELSADELRRIAGRPHVLNALLEEKKVTDLEILAVVPSDQTLAFQGQHIASVSASVDEAGQPCLDFVATAQGAKVLAAVTSTNLPDQITGVRRRLGIILDDQLLSAPAILSTISDRGRITGNFTRDEIGLLVAVLRAGELPAPLCREPTETVVVEPRDHDIPRE